MRNHPFTPSLLQEFKYKLSESEMPSHMVQINGVQHKLQKMIKEVEVFTDILNQIPAVSLNDKEKKVILDELKLSLKPMQPYLDMLESNSQTQS
jgi:DNA-binding FrmR family transcriptional regulator